MFLWPSEDRSFNDTVRSLWNTILYCHTVAVFKKLKMNSDKSAECTTAAYELICACEPEFLCSFVDSLLHSCCYLSLGSNVVQKQKQHTFSPTAHAHTEMYKQFISISLSHSQACFMHVILSFYTMLMHHTKKNS